MTENMNNYIGKVDAEWVDPNVELPPQRWRGTCRHKSGYVHSCVYDSGTFYLSGTGIPADEPLAWLRVGGPSTAIPRAAVQAAVDHLYECEEQADGGGDWAFREALDSIDHHTGVTPSEVPRD